MVLPHFRVWSFLVALALVAGLTTGTIAVDQRDAYAMSGCSTNSDNTGADFTVTASDGTVITGRALKPVSNAQCTKPQAGWPMVLYMQGSGSSRCSDQNWMSRLQLARFGYVVVSFNGRGMPGGIGSGTCGNSLAEMTDTINDSGWDATGPKDLQDAKDVISYALNASNGLEVDSGNVGAFGYSYDGARTWLLPTVDSRIKAIVPVGAPITSLIGNVSAISDRHVSEPSSGIMTAYQHAALGWYSNADPTVLTHLVTAARSRYLNQSVPAATQTWFDARTVLDDNSGVDKVSTTSIPTFIVHGFRDNTVDPSQAVEAWKKLPSGNKFLYLGACGHGAPCGSSNATTLRNKVHDFFDRYLQGSSVNLGGPIFFAVPPLNHSSDPWTLQSSASWPPPQVAGSPLSLYLRSGGTLSTSPPTTSEALDTITNPIWANSVTDMCTSQGYTTGEFRSYTSDTAASDFKLVQLEADLYLQSNNTRLQVVADLFEVNSTNGVETRIASGVSFKVPTARNVSANTPIRFQFRPTGSGYTIKQGNRLRLKVSSNYRGLYAAEPLPGTYSIHHTNTRPSKIVAYFAA